MKAKLQKLTATAVLGLALFSQSTPAWAGQKTTREVEIVPAQGGQISIAIGSMGGARYSADSKQYIGCSFSNTTGPFVTCSATDKTGKSAFCTSTDLAVAAVVKTITDFSRLYFEIPQGSASCRFLVAENSSQYLK
jgi:hypothetical protein